jgi:hypothetical protein
MSTRIPLLECFDQDFVALAKIVAKTSYLPHRDTVKALGGAAFPTARNNRKRITKIENGGVVVGMYDDNATPEWAIFWSHGFKGKRPKGWTIAHVWPESADITCYTHLANLVMVPECLASLTDKTGPLTSFLRWHSQSVYGWKPEKQKAPQQPVGYDEIVWRYLPRFDDPKGSIRQRLAELDNQRVQILRSVRGWP